MNYKQMDKMNYKQQNLQSLLDQVNTLLESNMRLDYAPQYGGFALFDLPRELRFLRTLPRLTRKEMDIFLYGVLCGIRA